MEFIKAYEYIKKHFPCTWRVAVVMLDDQGWFTDTCVLLQVENVPEEVKNKQQTWTWECPERCPASKTPQHCTSWSECCPNFDNGDCLEFEDCNKSVETCGHGVFRAGEWISPQFVTIDSIKQLLVEEDSAPEIKPGKNEEGRKTFYSCDMVVNIDYFNLFGEEGMRFFQKEGSKLNPIYVRDCKSNRIMGLLMPMLR